MIVTAISAAVLIATGIAAWRSAAKLDRELTQARRDGVWERRDDEWGRL